MKKEDLDTLGIRILSSQFTDKDLLILKKYCVESYNGAVFNYQYINIFYTHNQLYWMKSETNIRLTDIKVFRKMFPFKIQKKLK